MAICKRVGGHPNCYEFECTDNSGKNKKRIKISMGNENNARLEAERRYDDGEEGDKC